MCLPCGKRVRTGKLSASVAVPSEDLEMKSTLDAIPRERSAMGMDAFLLGSVQEAIAVLYYALMFLVVALIAAVLGMSGVAGVASQIA